MGAQAPGMQAQRSRVLLVEDEFLLADMVAEVLGEHGFEVITSRDLKGMGAGVRSALSKRLSRLKGHKVYVTFDIDFIDAACAPGVGSPEPFGPNSFEAVEALRTVTAVADDIVGCDLVKISPLHDVGQATSYLGAQLLFEMVSASDGAS